jgi:hypothetical protein
VPIPVALRPHYDAVRLRRLARQSKDAPQTRRGTVMSGWRPFGNVIVDDVWA